MLPVPGTGYNEAEKYKKIMWYPLQFDDENNDSTVQKIKWVDSFALDLKSSRLQGSGSGSPRPFHHSVDGLIMKVEIFICVLLLFNTGTVPGVKYILYFDFLDLVVLLILF